MEKWAVIRHAGEARLVRPGGNGGENHAYLATQRRQELLPHVLHGH
jgi:hypothetical protein